MSQANTSDLVSTVATQLNIVIVALRLFVDMIQNPDTISPAGMTPGPCLRPTTLGLLDGPFPRLVIHEDGKSHTLAPLKTSSSTLSTHDEYAHRDFPLNTPVNPLLFPTDLSIQ